MPPDTGLCLGEAPVSRKRASWLHIRAKRLCVQVRTASCSALNCVNTFGDEQLAVDVLADKLLFEALKYSVRAFEFITSWHDCNDTGHLA